MVIGTAHFQAEAVGLRRRIQEHKAVIELHENLGVAQLPYRVGGPDMLNLRAEYHQAVLQHLRDTEQQLRLELHHINTLHTAEVKVADLIETFTCGTAMQRRLNAIKNLAALPGGKQCASTYLFNLAHKYAEYTTCEATQFHTAKIVRTKYAALDSLLLLDILGPSWKALANAEQARGWNPTSVIDAIERFRQNNDAHFGEPLHLFGRSRALLHSCAKKRLATMLAIKAAGHLLPPELVEMIGEEIHSERSVKTLLG